MNTTTYLNTQRLEREADIFASELLISDKDILDDANVTTQSLALSLGVKEKHIIYKFQNIRSEVKWYQKY